MLVRAKPSTWFQHPAELNVRPPSSPSTSSPIPIVRFLINLSVRQIWPVLASRMLSSLSTARTRKAEVVRKYTFERRHDGTADDPTWYCQDFEGHRFRDLGIRRLKISACPKTTESTCMLLISLTIIALHGATTSSNAPGIVVTAVLARAFWQTQALKAAKAFPRRSSGTLQLVRCTVVRVRAIDVRVLRPTPDRQATQPPPRTVTTTL